MTVVEVCRGNDSDTIRREKPRGEGAVEPKSGFAVRFRKPPEDPVATNIDDQDFDV
jgi:hypothetical protein